VHLAAEELDVAVFERVDCADAFGRVLQLVYRNISLGVNGEVWPSQRARPRF